MTDPLQTGATIGILGGGQLGRMLSVAAARLGFRTHIFEPGANPPAADVAHAVTTAPYDDHKALEAFAHACDIVTFEFENIPTEALDMVEAITPLRPGREALRISQDRLTEKPSSAILACAWPLRRCDRRRRLKTAVAQIGTPAILKTRRFGYDDKGKRG